MAAKGKLDSKRGLNRKLFRCRFPKKEKERNDLSPSSASINKIWIDEPIFSNERNSKLLKLLDTRLSFNRIEQEQYHNSQRLSHLTESY